MIPARTWKMILVLVSNGYNMMLLCCCCCCNFRGVHAETTNIVESTVDSSNYTVTYDNITGFIEINPVFEEDSDAAMSSSSHPTRNNNTKQHPKKKKRKTHGRNARNKGIKHRSSCSTEEDFHHHHDDDDDDDDESDSEVNANNTANNSLSDKHYKSFLVNKLLALRKDISKVWVTIRKDKKLQVVLVCCGLLSVVVFLTNNNASSSSSLQRLLTFENIVRLLISFNLLQRFGIISFSDDDGRVMPFPKFILGHNNYKALDAYNPPIQQHFMFEKINDRYARDVNAIGKMLTTPIPSTPTPSSTTMEGSKSNGSALPEDTANMEDKVAVVMEVKADATFTQIDTFRDAISFLLSAFKTNPVFKEKKHLEVILVLESAGGLVSTYGLAAYELSRITTTGNNITLTVCVDKVAASGGYMMASQATPGQLFTAPFAILGSIGVIGQTINVHNVLQSYGIKPLVFKSGEQKSPVGLIGEVTQEGIAKVQQSLDDIHVAFKTLVIQSRKNVNIDKVSTGDIWLGREAVEIGLADKVLSSKEYIAERIIDGDTTVLQLKPYQREPPFAAFLRSSSSRSYPFMKIMTLAANGAKNALMQMVTNLAAAAADGITITTSGERLEIRSLDTHIDARCTSKF